MRNSFVFYKSWVDALNTLPEEYQFEGYKAVAYYGVNGRFPRKVSAVVKSLLVSVSVGMDRSIARYNACVENGKKGGRPKKELIINDLNEVNQNLEKPKKTKQNLDKPSVTQQNLDKPNHNLNVNYNYNDNVNYNVNIYSKLINNIFNNLNACAGARARERKDFERQPIIDYFSSFFGLYRGKYYDAGLEIVDCILEALDMSYYGESGLIFKGQRYSFDSFLQIVSCVDSEEFGKIVNQLVFNGIIEARHWYVLGCLFKVGSEEETTRNQKEREEFVKQLSDIYSRT